MQQSSSNPKRSSGKQNFAWVGDREPMEIHTVYIICISELACNIFQLNFRGLEMSLVILQALSQLSDV